MRRHDDDVTCDLCLHTCQVEEQQLPSHQLHAAFHHPHLQSTGKRGEGQREKVKPHHVTQPAPSETRPPLILGPRHRHGNTTKHTTKPPVTDDLRDKRGFIVHAAGRDLSPQEDLDVGVRGPPHVHSSKVLSLKDAHDELRGRQQVSEAMN
ncbi:hypothetical protein EYF80_035526 [Liparis tanakae]|uniref:Uncharacterized protein n=1 Tax=Liparis tanakae TaxID=230148 RepID=A0A4Z2GL22_9TELE|nr:hypothetical protein EYF80_035526 [Liparis tanakae]